MKRSKTNGVIALILSGAILLGSVGLVLARENGSAYQAPDLLLTQGQAAYDLLDGISYDGEKYELSVCDEGGFDVNVPGSYTVEYVLTPIAAPAPGESPAPVPEETPAATPAPGESPAPAPGETSAPATPPVPETSAPATPPVPETSAPTPESVPTLAPAEPSAPASEEPLVPDPGAAPPVENAPIPAPDESTPDGQPADMEIQAEPVPRAALPGDLSGELASSDESSAAESEAAPGSADPGDTVPDHQTPDVPPTVSPSDGGQQTEPAPETGGTPPASEPVQFSRVVIVQEAVQYQNIRFDVDNAEADLLTGIAYDKAHYALSIQDDGGFDGSRIDEYKVVYRLINTDSGLPVTDLERYVWITAPGVAFDAPELKLAVGQTQYDLMDGITYDTANYTLSVMAPEAFNTTVAGERRVMFLMTERGQEVPPAESGDPSAAMTAEDAAAPEPAAPETTAGPMAAIFGRDVQVADGAIVIIDAPPLVVMAGSVGSHNLLEGVTAKDEAGNAVETQVEDRSELDHASEMNALRNEPQALQNSLPAAEPTAEPTAEPAGSAPKSAELPRDLEPGEYSVTLAAEHPATGAIFTAQRSVSVLAAGQEVELSDGTHKIDVSKSQSPLKITGKSVVLKLSGTGTINPSINGNAIALSAGSTLFLVLESGADVTLRGEDTTSNIGRAALYVPSSARLFVLGTGKLTAFGGNGGDGGLAFDFRDHRQAGYGGGGAGAGIGGNGGMGGFASINYTTPKNGGDGGKAGQIFIYTAPGQIVAQGGNGGTSGGAGDGSLGGGGSGFPAAGIGGGGAGGGGAYMGGGGGFSGGAYGADPAAGKDGGDGGGIYGGQGWFSGSLGKGNPTSPAYNGKNGGDAGPFGGIGLMQNGDQPSGAAAKYGSVEIVKQVLTGYPSINDPTSPYYGMGVGIGKKDKIDPQTGNASVGQGLDASGNLKENTYYIASNPPPPIRISAVREGAAQTAVTLKWTAPPNAAEGYSLPGGYDYTSYVIRYYDAASTKPDSSGTLFLKPDARPFAVLTLPLSGLTPDADGFYSHTETLPETRFASVSAVAGDAAGDTLPSVPAAAAVTEFTLPRYYDDPARVISESGQYHINVNASRGYLPLDITAARATIYLSGKTTLSYDTTNGSSIRIAPGSQVALVLENGADIKAVGRPAKDGVPGAPAIAVPESASLHIVGPGRLAAFGGAAANGGALGGGGAGAGIGGGGGIGGNGGGGSGQAAGPVYLYTGTVNSYGGRGGNGGDGAPGTGGYYGGDGQNGPSGSGSATGGGGGGYPGAGIGGGGAGGGGTASADGGGGFAGGGGGENGAGGQGFINGSAAGGAANADGGPFAPFGGVVLMGNGTDTAKPLALYGGTDVIRRRNGWEAFTGADKASPFYGMGIGLGKPGGAETAGLNGAAAPTETDIATPPARNSYHTSLNPAMPVEVSAHLTPWLLDTNKALHVSWQAPGDGIGGYALPDGTSLTGFAVSFYTGEPKDGVTAAAQVEVPLADLTYDAAAQRYSYDFGAAADGAKWVSVRTVSALAAGGQKRESVETVERVEEIRVNYPDSSVSYYPSLALALDGIAAKNAQGAHTVSLLRDYTAAAADLEALAKVGGSKSKLTKLTLDGLCMDDALVPRGDQIFSLTAEGDLLLPETGPEFLIRRIGLNTTAERFLAARGSKLTVGEGVTAAGPWRLVGGGTEPKARDTDLTVASGTWARLYGGNTGSNAGRTSKLTITGDVTAGELYQFDSLSVAAGKTLTVTARMSHDEGHTDYVGVISLGADAALTLPRPAGADPATQLNRAGQVNATGTGAALVLARTGSGYPNLFLTGDAPDTAGGRLALKYPAGETPKGGDLLLRFGTPMNAAPRPDGDKVDNSYARDFLNGLGVGTIDLTADPQTGLIYLLGTNFTLTKPGGTAAGYHSLAEVAGELRADQDQGGLAAGAYTITLLSDYTLTPEDRTAFSALTGLSQAADITLTGTGGVGPVLDLGSDGLAFPASQNAAATAAFRLADIRLTGSGTPALAAMGSKLTVDTGVELTGGSWRALGGAGSNDALSAQTDLTVNSGAFTEIMGGSGGGGLLTGSTKVTIGGTAHVAGDVYGAGVNQAGASALTIAGSAAVDGVVYGSYGAHTGASVVNLNGGAVSAFQNLRYAQPGTSGPETTLNVSGTHTLKYIKGFSALNLRDSAQLTLTDAAGLDAFWQNTSAAGAVTIGAGGSLTLPGALNRAGSLSTTGADAKLSMSLPSEEPPLTLSNSTTPVNTREHPITLEGRGKAPSNKQTLIRFTGLKGSANAADYLSGFGGDLAILADPNTGDVYLGYTVSVTNDIAQTAKAYGSLAQAMAAIGTNTGSYTVAIHAQDYKLTATDGLAVAKNGGNAASITFTSRVTLSADYPMGPGEAIGQTVTRTVIVGDGKPSGMQKADISLNSATIIRNMHLDYRQEGCSLYANGHKLTVGPEVDITSTSQFYPVFYGGAKDSAVSSTDMMLASGNYGGVFGGGRETGGTVSGDTKVTFTGGAVLTGPMYGGGEKGGVTGTAQIIINGGRAETPAGGRNTVVGGGKVGDVGAVNITISGGKANGTMEVAGCDSGNVIGDVHIIIKEEAEGEAPKAPMANICGASLQQSSGGTVGGNIEISVTNGKRYGAIHGGKSGLSSAGTSATITLKNSAIVMTDLSDFDTLNLGVANAPDSRTTLVLKGKLQGGDLNFWSGSILTLQGASTDPNDLTIRNLKTDDTANRSHLHVYKAPGADNTRVTRPLHVTGENVSTQDNKLVLGVYGTLGDVGGDPQIGVLGDDLLVFNNPANAKPMQYVSDVQGLDVVPAGPSAPSAIELGLGQSPTIALTGVRHTDAGGQTTQADQTGVSPIKTLTFDIKSFNDNNHSEPGSAITSAYVSKSSVSDTGWSTGGAIPAGGTEITVAQKPADSVDWTGTVTMEIAPPTGPTPEYYFAHVRDSSNRVRTIVLDVHSASRTQSAQIVKDSGESYTFTVTLKDPKPEKPPEVSPDIIYTASGLQQLAWTVGTANEVAGQADALAATMATGGILKDVKTLPVPVTDPYEWTFTVPAADLGPDPAEKVVYLYSKDAMGNTGVYAIPLSDNLIDVEIPTAAGMIALRGGDNPRLLAPNCYLVNRSARPVTAELVGATIPGGQGTGGDGKLVLTDKGASFANNEINLMVLGVSDGLGVQFHSASLVRIAAGTPVSLGTMPAVNEANHGASFTFTALYDPKTILQTGGWSTCVLSYRFTIAPPAPAPVTGGDTGG